MTQPQTPRPTFEMRQLAELTSHPLNARAFAAVNNEEVQLLANDIQARGLQHYIEILPDGTMLAGHRRAQALTLLKRQTTKCRVRHDLADDPVAAAMHLIRDNLSRRQLSPLEIVRATRVEAEHLAALGEHRGLPYDLMNEITGRLGCTQRTARRYLRLLQTPLAIQDAFQRGELSLVMAESVAGLAADKQQTIEKRISGGQPPAQVVKEAFAKRKPRVASLLTVAASLEWELPRLIEVAKKVQNTIGLGKPVRGSTMGALRRATQSLGSAIGLQLEENIGGKASPAKRKR